MDFHPFPTNREACSKSRLVNTADEFYAMATAEAISPVWTGRGRAVPKVVPRRGSVVHRELVEKVPSGFGA